MAGTIVCRPERLRRTSFTDLTGTICHRATYRTGVHPRYMLLGEGDVESVIRRKTKGPGDRFTLEVEMLGDIGRELEFA